MDILSLGEKIKKRRKELNMTLKDLAGERITPGQISLVESGRSNPSMDLLEYLSKQLKTSIEYLMESEATQAKRISKYSELMAENYILCNDLEKANEYLKKAEAYAERYSLDIMRARVLFLRAEILMKQKDYFGAQELLLSANVIFIKYNCFDMITKTFLNLGKITFNLRAYHSSTTYLGQAERSYEDGKLNNEYLLSEIYFFKTLTAFKQEKDDESKKYILLTQERLEVLHDKKKYAKELIDLSERCFEEDSSKAIEFCYKALNELKICNSEKIISGIEHSLGKILYDYEKIGDSLVHFNKAKEIRLRNSDTNVIETMICICENLLKQKEMDKCMDMLVKLTEVVDEHDYESKIKINNIKYRIASIYEDTTEAEAILKNTYDIAKESNDKNLISQTSILIGKFYLDQKKFDEAKLYLDESVSILKDAGIIK